MIEVDGLTRYYGSFPAVRDVSFVIEDREIVGFLGLNGAGKSTTLRILAGLLLPSGGSVKIAGVDAVEAPDSLRSRIGFLPEDPPLYEEMRVDDFLIWCGQVRGRSKQQVREALPEVLDVCKIDDAKHKLIGELSHGYRKRVGIAQAIVHKPELVILDEPISGLDPVQIVEMRKVVRALKAECTVLISSHILSEIAQTCDRILVIHGGKLVAEGTEEDLAGDLGGGGRINLSLRGERDLIESTLGDAELIESFELDDTSDGIVEVRAQLKEDRPEEVVRALVEAGIGLRRLEPGEAELEQIFLELTKPGEQAKPKEAEA